MKEENSWKEKKRTELFKKRKRPSNRNFCSRNKRI